MKVGDKVGYKKGVDVLHCSHHVYPYAIVKSLDPFILVSEEGDMTWYGLTKSELEVIVTVG